MSTTQAGWLDILRSSVQREDGFYAQMDEQLGAAFLRVVGEPIVRCKLYPPGMFTLPPRAEMFAIEQEGETFSLVGGLLNVDTLFEVRLAWRASQDGHVFWWLDLPAAEIRETLAERRAPFVDVDVAVPVTVRDPVWPSVKLTFDVAPEADPGALAVAIAEAIEDWNSRQDDGVVHRSGPIEAAGVQRFSVAIDMGSAGIDFLHGLLRKLSLCGIKSATLDS
jgi:hypothetical protein